MLGGDDFLEVTGGSNYANGNTGEDTIILRGGFGEYLGGKGSDNIEVFGAEEGTSVNGNMGKDFITGTVAGVIYRGGKDNDLLAVSQGDVWGDKNADTFRAVSGDGFAVIQDYTIGEDMVKIEMDGSWSNVGDGLMFTDDSGDQLMLLLGISDVEQVTMV
jgi:Ca2+-binding RTX toxin-like protein